MSEDRTAGDAMTVHEALVRTQRLQQSAPYTTADEREALGVVRAAAFSTIEGGPMRDQRLLHAVVEASGGWDQLMGPTPSALTRRITIRALRDCLAARRAGDLAADELALADIRDQHILDEPDPWVASLGADHGPEHDPLGTVRWGADQQLYAVKISVSAANPWHWWLDGEQVTDDAVRSMPREPHPDVFRALAAPAETEAAQTVSLDDLFTPIVRDPMVPGLLRTFADEAEKLGARLAPSLRQYADQYAAAFPPAQGQAETEGGDAHPSDVASAEVLDGLRQENASIVTDLNRALALAARWVHGSPNGQAGPGDQATREACARELMATLHLYGTPPVELAASPPAQGPGETEKVAAIRGEIVEQLDGIEHSTGPSTEGMKRALTWAVGMVDRLAASAPVSEGDTETALAHARSEHDADHLGLSTPRCPWCYPSADPTPQAGRYAGVRLGPVPNYETAADRALAERVVRDDGPWVQALTADDGSVFFEAEVLGYRDHPSFDLRRTDGVVRSWPAGLVREVPSGAGDAAGDAGGERS